jgi:hypothetical protein
MIFSTSVIQALGTHHLDECVELVAVEDLSCGTP